MNKWTVTDQNDLFTLHEMKSKPYEHSDLTWIQLTIEMDLNRMEYHRSRYTVLDLLAQFGGFIGIFGRLFGYFMAAWNFNALEKFLVTRLFQMSGDDDEEPRKFQRSMMPDFRNYAMSWVPTCLACKCCKKGNKGAQAMAVAQKKLANEMDIIKMI